jgi:hypothetical protein
MNSLRTETIDSFERNIEQLKEAALQLNKDNIINTRIAFLLVHNVLDLLTYDFTKYTLMSSNRQEISGKEILKLLSDFNERVKYLTKKESVLKEEDRDILKVLQYIRNESYHTGEIRSGIMPLVTRISYNKACELLKLLSLPPRQIPDNISIPANNISDYDNYFPGCDNDVPDFNNCTLTYKNYIQNYVDNCFNSFEIESQDLAREMSKDLLVRIEYVFEDLSTICRENIEVKDETTINSILVLVQSTYWDETILGLTQYKNFNDAISVTEKRLANNTDDDDFYSNRYTYQEIKKWKKQAENLEKANKYDRIFMKWKEIDEKLAHIELMLEAASIDIDDWLDWEIEVERNR